MYENNWIPSREDSIASNHISCLKSNARLEPRRIACENACFEAELKLASVRIWQAGRVLAFAVAGGLRVLDTWIVSCLLNLFKNGSRR